MPMEKWMNWGSSACPWPAFCPLLPELITAKEKITMGTDHAKYHPLEVITPPCSIPLEMWLTN